MKKLRGLLDHLTLGSTTCDNNFKTMRRVLLNMFRIRRSYSKNDGGIRKIKMEGN